MRGAMKQTKWLPTGTAEKQFARAGDLVRARRALVIAGDDREAKATVSRLLDQFGFDTVDAGPLKEGWRIERHAPGESLQAR